MDLIINTDSVKKGLPPQSGLALDKTEGASEIQWKGIQPSLLIDQVRNTAPYLFDLSDVSPFAEPHLPQYRYLSVLRSPKSEWGAYDYYELCLSAHFASVATPVPTDVDNQIRFKLWNPQYPLAVLEAQADLVLEAYHWDSTLVSERWVKSPRSGQVLAGHAGEWFSVAAAGYSSLRKRSKDRAESLREKIFEEVSNEASVFDDLVEADDGIGALQASAQIAHNLGDLDRVIEQWGLPDEDALRSEVFKLGHSENSKRGLSLKKAGDLYKAFMAEENHRHFALRKPRALRKSRDLIVPIGPFFDAWGRKVGKHINLSFEDIAEIVECLIEGWHKLDGKAYGYARALSGIESVFPGGLNQLSNYLPARAAREMRSGPLRALIAVSQDRFEKQWNHKALQFLKNYQATK